MKNLKAVTQFENTGWPPKCQPMNQNFEIKTYDPKDTTTEDFFEDSQFEEATVKPIEPISDAMLQLFFRNIESWTKEITGSHAPEMIEKAITRNVKDLKEHIAKHYTINADFAKAIQHVKIADNKPAA